jgi:hypothetical protein
MRKSKNILLGCLFVALSSVSFAAELIPDPTVEPMTPPAGLPGVDLAQPLLILPTSLGLNLSGVFIVEDTKKENIKNKAFINSGVYKVGDIVEETWKVNSITRKKVVLNNINTKENKTLNISGEE